MADSVTIARPYAKAVFELASAQNKLSLWLDYLNTLAAWVQDKTAIAFLTNPQSRISDHTELLMYGLSQRKIEILPEVKNFVQTLASNKRLLILPQISELYETMRAQAEKTIVVEVSSYLELSNAEQQQLIMSLSKRLNRQVSLNLHIDNALMGGAVIRADDLFIDGSVRGKINKLRAALAA